MEIVLILPLCFILMCCLFGVIHFQPEVDRLREERERAIEERLRIQRDLNDYIDKLMLDMENPVEHRAVVERPPKRAIEEQLEKLADVRNRAFPPPDPATAQPEMEPYYPPPPSWDGFTRQYPPPPPPQQGDKQ